MTALISMERLSYELIVGLLAALFLNSLVLVAFRYWIRGQVLLNVVALFYWMQICWLIASCLLIGSAELLININTDLWLDLNEAPYRVPLGLTIMPLVALLCAALIPSGVRNPFEARIIDHPPQRALAFILYIFALEPVFFILGVKVFDGSLFGPLFLYAYLSLYMTPVLLGIYWRRYRGPFFVFLCTMLIAGFIAFSEGSRTLIFIPAVLFASGVWLTLNARRRVAMLLIGLLVSFPVFYISSIIENVRWDIRNATAKTTTERVYGMIEAITHHSSSTNSTAGEIVRGVNRMIMTCNPAVLALTPQTISYRGFADFADEIRYTNKTTLGEGGQNLAELQFEHEVGIAAANIYGFGACVGGSVPFSVVADGWSRAGLIGAAGFSLILCLMWGSIEFFARRLLAGKPYFIPAFLAIFAFSAFERASIYPLVYNLRYLIMQLIIWTIFFYAISRGVPAKRKLPQ